ncbi:MAG: cytidine deaminase [Prolixibacteraceae bacterium]|jgi:cytidine deaminase|nr:cytidine deaminase [Prolixibacteraceae bacterium]
MKEIQLKFKIKIYQSLEELPLSMHQLILKAREAAQRAYAPYSGYRVGAAVLLGNGEIVTGNNQENAAYPSGLCAERTAMFYASSRFPGEVFIAIAVSTVSNSVTLGGFAKPCGSCRQVMAEYEDLFGIPMEIILDGSSTITVMNGIDTLLPFRFKKEDMGK